VLIASPKAGVLLWLVPVAAVVTFCCWTLHLWRTEGSHAFQLNEERRKLGDLVGIAATAFCFALIHQSQLGYAWGPLLLLFFVGLVLTAVRARLRTVAGSFLIHVAYNSTLVFLHWVSTDHFRHMEKAAMIIVSGSR
jgi:CAAX protease family protein